MVKIRVHHAPPTVRLSAAHRRHCRASLPAASHSIGAVVTPTPSLRFVQAIEWEREEPKSYCLKFAIVWLINFEFLSDFKNKNYKFI